MNQIFNDEVGKRNSIKKDKKKPDLIQLGLTNQTHNVGH
jgi:hypothetical protein